MVIPAVNVLVGALVLVDVVCTVALIESGLVSSIVDADCVESADSVKAAVPPMLLDRVLDSIGSEGVTGTN